MIEQHATVVALDGVHAWVETERVSACGACVAQKGCGTSALSKLLGHQVNRIKVLNEANARVGDQVVVGLEEAALLRGSVAVYLVPLGGLIGGGIVGQAYGGGGDLMSGLGALTGFVLSFLWLRRFSRRVSTSGRYQAVIVRTMGPAAVDGGAPLTFYPNKP